MIARLFVLLPFKLTVPEGQQYPVYEAEDSGYKVRFYPPGRSDYAPPIAEEDKITIDDVLAFQADALRIDFQKENFDRRAETLYDPPSRLSTEPLTFS
jgi:hypothetical protein